MNLLLIIVRTSFCTSGLPAESLIDRYVTIGAYSLLRSCTIEPECIIGQHSILMEGSLVETHSILEAGSVVPPGRRIPSGELWAGNPARFVRTLTHEETLEIPKLAVAINDLSREHFSEFLPYSTVYLEVEKFKKSLGISIWDALCLSCLFNVSVSWNFACKEIRTKQRANWCISWFAFLSGIVVSYKSS